MRRGKDAAQQIEILDIRKAKMDFDPTPYCHGNVGCETSVLFHVSLYEYNGYCV